MQENIQESNKSTWTSKFSALGPGILMASAAVGGSHIIASTQAGAIYGWQLALIIILANVFKYPFFVSACNIRWIRATLCLKATVKKASFIYWYSLF